MLKEYDAAVVACFGTGNPVVFKKTFYHLYEELANSLDLPCYLVLTSSIFLHKANITALKFKDIYAKGHRNIIVIPLILADGNEYQNIIKEIENSEFNKATILKPMLEEYKNDIAAFIDKLLVKDGHKYCLLGHGSHLSDNHEYEELAKELKRRDRDDITVSLMIDENHDENAKYFPLFLCAGHHYQKYQDEHPNSFYYQKGLAEYAEIVEMIRGRIKR